MNRFIWLIRREVWEHKAVWIAPAILIGCLFGLLIIARTHLGHFDLGASLGSIPQEGQIRLHQFAYSIVAAIVFLVMGIICFFYSIDSLYADRSDRSVLFWKSLPLSDAETVLSKFAMAAVVIPIIALVGSVIAQALIGGGLMAKLAISGQAAGLWLHPQSLAGGALIALVAGVGAMLWYAPMVAYLMLASAWAPRAVFLWAVLPPVAICIVERLVTRSEFFENLFFSRLLGIYSLLESGAESDEKVDSLADFASRLGQFDFQARVIEFYSSPELWIGLVAAGLLLAAAVWVRRYRDETA